MAKYKLTVKYKNVCDLSIAGDLPDIIANEFDQYVKSMLYKKEEWENFEANFKLAAKKEYGNLKKEAVTKEALEESFGDTACDKDLEESVKEENSGLDEDSDGTLDGALKGALDEIPDEVSNEASDGAEGEMPQKAENKEEPIKPVITSFIEYIKDKNINTPLDEFVAGACYLDGVLNVKEFSLKQLNSKLYPAFGRLASLNIIDEAFKRVLIESVEEDGHQRYKINQNAWNYHNYDLVKHPGG